MELRPKRRMGIRFQMHAPAIVEWSVQKGKREQRAGFTRDVCRGGAFVFCASPPLPETPARVEILLSQRQGPCLRIRAEGRVIRVEGSGGERGFAFVGSFAIPDPKRLKLFNEGSEAEAIEGPLV